MKEIRIFVILSISASCAVAAPSANFDSDDLIVRDGRRSSRINGVLDPHAFYGTIHAVHRRGQDFFVVYGTSEMSRGWPPKGGYCGCGLESYIRWLHIRDGKIMEQQEGRQESCYQNRDGWSIAWQQGKLIWNTEGFEREGDPINGKIVSIAFTWTFDPVSPEAGILETKSPTKRQPEPAQTEQTASSNGYHPPCFHDFP